VIPWRSRSLVTRLTVLFTLIVCAAVTGVGIYLYTAASMALNKQADYSTVARIEHFRTLLHDLYTVNQLEARPALFETMLGNEKDVIVFRKPGETPFINVNPEQVALPPITPVAVDQSVRLDALHAGQRPDGLRVRWVAAMARVGENGDVVEIMAAHVMTQEALVLDIYFWRVAGTVIVAVLLTALLGYFALSRSLRPVRVMAHTASRISPANLSVRLDEAAPGELRILALAFNAMLDRLAQGYERLSQFSADLAHEVRTPIGVLIGQTQVILAHPREAAEYQGVLESNLEELERLSHMAQNILFLAQADHARLTVARSDLDLSDEIDMVTTYFEGLAEERDLAFRIQALGHVHANDLMCRRAMSNLVVNAVRYARAGSTIHIHGNQDANGATIVIRNQGDVLTPDTLGRLFDRFYRGDSARSEFTESSGLGLAIVKAIMGLHQGSVAAECDEQGWISFTLFFPNADQRSGTARTV
jgi:two-component system heavy metal sensor histidine kinase CusS